ncbi:hypothetical protein [Sulfurovum riftiae]|uniref:Uncharacterized protein n=1 Tax=Sulfurovum riftiae TaxID=1630136 RepID=A0A151CEE9_9BACT|nr:hypothetical protein [Sulfurovum riftiae]KYJ85895.1 hypothetical protein AS592_04705 [Sulfurovum riftiae]
MIKKLSTALILVSLSGTLYLSAETKLEPFTPKLQVGTELSVDKIKEQNLNVVRKAVEGIGEHLPEKVDQYTTLTGIDSNGTRLIYIFEVDGGMRSDEALKEDGKKRMAPVIKAGICQGSQRFLQADINISYRYLSKASKNEILRVDVSKEDCR